MLVVVCRLHCLADGDVWIAGTRFVRVGACDLRSPTGTSFSELFSMPTIFIRVRSAFLFSLRFRVLVALLFFFHERWAQSLPLSCLSEAGVANNLHNTVALGHFGTHRILSPTAH